MQRRQEATNCLPALKQSHNWPYGIKAK